MTLTRPELEAPAAVQAGASPARQRRQRSREAGDRGLVSPNEWKRPSLRRRLRASHVVLLVLLVIFGLGPILWLAKSAITPTQDTLRTPLAMWPNGIKWSTLSTAWTRENLDRYFVNTLIVAAGSWASQLFVAATGGYALSVLRPRFGSLITGLVLATLLVPSIVLLVPLYLTILDIPVFHISLLNSYWAVWLPAAANPFNLLLVKRFFDNLPREVFEAARLDGAGPYRLFQSIVLPMSRPILGVVSVFAILAAWKDFLWPLLVLPDPERQPLSVRLPTLADRIDLETLLASLFISTAIPIVLFLVFQRTFLRSAGLGGAIKG